MKGVVNVKRPICDVQGTENNLYALIGKVSKTLEDAGLHDLVQEFVQRSLSANTYSEVFTLGEGYVDFEDRSLH